MKWLGFPLVVTFVFAILVTVPFEGAGSRARGFAEVMGAIRPLFAEPMTLAGAILLVFAGTALVSFLVRQNGRSAAGNDNDARRSSTVGDHDPAREPQKSAAAKAERRSFGKKTQSQTGETKMMGEFAETAKRLLRNRGIDWYISEHGFEGQWQTAVRELREAGDHELATELQAGGEIYDRCEAIRVLRDDGELTQDETRAYFEELRPIEKRIRALLEA